MDAVPLAPPGPFNVDVNPNDSTPPPPFTVPS
jgi:hypothetical protein